MWEPMAVAIMVGLLFATVITLLFVPVLYKNPIRNQILTLQFRPLAGPHRLSATVIESICMSKATNFVDIHMASSFSLGIGLWVGCESRD